ncbi:WD repeat-containing protein 43 [Orchesella cincta]|uniref:WD repeat-containing protein 43 n=1 Tax=Orchesella cincta TaxID=48709 RepID=A0A1D2M9N3_ORCCI|nr:WD repeat-containing protein 43 [Orchesella cincta]
MHVHRMGTYCQSDHWQEEETEEDCGRRSSGDGPATGALLFYGVTKAQLLSQHKDAHSGKVTGVSWSSSSLLLYSCGEDGYISEWDPETTKSISRWRGSKTALSAVRAFGNAILTAGHGIMLWDLKTKTSTMTFTGHPSLITQLEIISGTDYFVTMCQTERHLRIWSSKERNSVLTLTVPEPPQNFSVLNSDNGHVAVATVSQKGPLHLFRHKLNGPVKKPLLPSVSLKIVDSLDDNKCVPLLASHISDEADDDNMTLLASYGSWLRLRFEKFPVSSLDSHSVLKREYSTQKKKSKNKQLGVSDSFQSPEVVEVPNDVKHLQPGLDSLALPPDSKAKKRKKAGEERNEDGMIVDDGELPMEERLNNLAIDTPASGSLPSASNLSHLLSQGLHSKDSRILQSVLCRWDENIISSTVRSLPVQLIIPLLNEIKGMLAGKAQQNHSLLKWLKNIFQIHSAFLMACPSSEELLSPYLSLLRSREVLYPQMCQLKGKLELIKGNIKAKEFKAEQPNEALLVYQDESSDEDKEDDTFLPSESEGFLETDDDLGVDDDKEDDASEDDEDDSDMDDQDDSGESDSSDDEKTKKVKKTQKINANHNHNDAESEDLMDEDD